MSKFLVKCTIIAVGILFGVCLSAENAPVRHHGLRDGMPVLPGQLPYIASLAGHLRKYAADAHHIGTKYYACTGVLVSLQWVLTNGRCGRLLKDSLGKDLFVSAGSTMMTYQSGVDFDGEVETASEIVFYQDHAFPDFSMALFKVKTPFKESDLLKPVNFSQQLNHTFRNCRNSLDVYGFGSLNENTRLFLQHALLPMRHFEVCANETPSIAKMSDFAFCIGTVLKLEHAELEKQADASSREPVLCREDNGLPVSCKGFLVGFTSSLYKMPLGTAECTPANASSVFLWTDGILKWIGEKSGVDVSYTTVSTSTATTPTTPRGDERPSGASYLSTREPILLLMFIYLGLYLI